MARARNIKPSIMENEELADLEPIARLLFIYLWMLADREGRLEDRPKRIAGRALPYDRAADVDALLQQLHDCGFIRRYSINECKYIQIVSFEKHQHPHCKEAPSTIPAPGEHGASTVQAPEEHGTSPADSLLLIPDSLNLIPDPPIPARTPTQAAELSKVMMQAGIQSSPMDPRVLKLADNGVTQEALQGAIDTAKQAKPGQRISLGYVIAILERWTREAEQIKAKAIPTRRNLHDERAETIAALTGRAPTAPKSRDITGEAQRVA